MRIHLATALPEGQPSPIPHFEALQRQDRFGVHSLCPDPEAADAILFVDPHLHGHRGDWRISAIRRHPLAREFPHKALVFDERDDPWPEMRGIYVSLPAPLFNAALHRAYCYPAPMNELVADDLQPSAAPDLLFSFVGTLTHPVRRSVLELEHPRGHIERNVVDMFNVASAEIQERKKKFAQVLARSKFVLCPRGIGTASIRVFESLRAGRVPVVISDDWVTPAGPNWSLCSLRVREDQVASVPKLLEQNEWRWEEMSRAARQTHKDWFGPRVMFHRIGESCAQILESDFARGRPMPTRQFVGFAARNLAIRARVRAGASRARLQRMLRRGN